MLLRSVGFHAELLEVRERCEVDGQGTSALALLRAARGYGLVGRGLRVEVEELDQLPCGTILHWDLQHFVVLERVRTTGIRIIDPARGRRWVPMAEVRRSFTGVAVELRPGETFAPRKASTGPVRSFVGRMLANRPLIAKVLLSSGLLQLLALGLPVLTGLIVDRVVPMHDLGLLTVVAAGLGIAVVLQFLLGVVRGYLLLQMRAEIDTSLSLGVVDHLMHVPFAFFGRRSAGDLMMRVNSSARVRELATSGTMTALLDGSMALGYLAVLGWISPTMGALAAGVGVVQAGAFVVSRRRYAELMTESLDARGKSQGQLNQMIRGAETLKASGAEDFAVERWSNLYVDELNLTLQRERLAMYLSNTSKAIEVGGALLILSLGAVLVVDGSLSLGTMLALGTLAAGVVRPITGVVDSGLKLQRLGGYVERLRDILDVDCEGGQRGRKSADLCGRVDVEGLSFRYGPRSEHVLRDVDVTIGRGTTTALVGPSGGGKSTLARLLVGLHEAETGTIRFDGEDMGQLDLQSLRRQCGVVPQDPVVFAGTIWDNITLSRPEASMDDVVRAATLACLHDDIVAMPLGYYSLVADAGSSLSGGQRQRLALARALLHRPKLLLLDEATSALDTETERRVIEQLERLPCTKIVIAHRLSTVVGADQILVLERGRIVARGRHHDLVDSQPVYRRLVSAQMQGGVAYGRT